jgi:hypothetical protein
MPRRRKEELISNALSRLAEGQYDIGGAGETEKVIIYLAGPTLEDVGNYLKPFLNEVWEIKYQENEKLMDCEFEYHELIHEEPLIYNWSNWWTFQLVKAIFPDELANRKPPETLRPEDYEQVIRRIYDRFHELFSGMGDKNLQADLKSLIEGRTRLSPAEILDLEEKLLAQHTPTDISDLISNEFARRIAGKFPKIVSRAEGLNTLPVTLRVPRDVQQYLKEATECFIFGQFIACLILCRSAIEFAIKDCLVRNGHGGALQDLKAGREDSLKNLIALAKDKLPRGFDSALYSADLVRREASRAVHEGVPTVDICKDKFLQTRSALKDIYTKKDLARP